ncbi:MAG: dienelactone hydrolase family protein [Alphaproteobacteria bacterium]|nr:dienelactone hydrolase family protein [Alphaproteobacteria bacterium]
MTMVTIKAADGGSFQAYLAKPKSAKGGAVVVIQEIFGINEAMRAISDAIADMGFFAICPDLFWRIEPGVNITDKTDAEWAKAFDLFKKFDQDKGIEDLKATAAHARTLPGCNGKVGSMGYCLGGRLAYLMAARAETDCNVSFYGVGIDGLLGEAGAIKRPLLMHIAALDKYVPPEAQEKIRVGLLGNPLVRVHTYPGVDHAFARVNGIHWDGRAAAIANGRTAEFLGNYLD